MVNFCKTSEGRDFSIYLKNNIYLQWFGNPEQLYVTLARVELILFDSWIEFNSHEASV